MSKNSVTFACQITTLTPEDRERHSVLVAQIGSDPSRVVEELENGYRVRFRMSNALWTALLEWAKMESLCCPFLDISLTLNRKDDLVKILVTGPADVKPFLMDELGPLFSSVN